MNANFELYKKCKNYNQISPYYFFKIISIHEKTKIDILKLEEKFLKYKNSKYYRLYKEDFELIHHLF